MCGDCSGFCSFITVHVWGLFRILPIHNCTCVGIVQNSVYSAVTPPKHRQLFHSLLIHCIGRIIFSRLVLKPVFCVIAGWMVNDDLEYLVVSDQLDFTAAQTMCQGMNSRLTSITSQEEHNFISSQLNNSYVCVDNVSGSSKSALCGIVSRGDIFECAAYGHPGIYAEVSYHIDWIKNHTE